MHYTPEEVAKLLANRPNQPHYIASLIAECVAAERERCKNLADLAVSYAKDADWSRVDAVLGLL